jgi:hypothetical protein
VCVCLCVRACVHVWRETHHKSQLYQVQRVSHTPTPTPTHPHNRCAHTRHAATIFTLGMSLKLFILLHMCPHSILCVLILLCMCPHTTKYVSSYYYICALILLYVSSYYYICVRILLYMCPQTHAETIYSRRPQLHASMRTHIY